MSVKNLDITILSKVVDNFGDIGVCWRLARELLNKYPNGEVSIRLVTDNLLSFSKINSRINPSLSEQDCTGAKIYNWNDYDFCYSEFTRNLPLVILECFQCGRPEWMEKILFEDKLPDVVNIIMIDYLSAEKYQEDFHCLKSLTRSARVQKVNFMPGFTPKTGGLLCGNLHGYAGGNQLGNVNQLGYTQGVNLHGYERGLNLHGYARGLNLHGYARGLLFAYNRNWDFLPLAMSKFFSEDCELLIAEGQGKASLLQAFKDSKTQFKITSLDYMNQESWDEMMRSCDFLLVRGEDSLAQACLLGKPFIWQAYPQSEDYQTVKVMALLERMKIHFGAEFETVKNAWMALNEGVQKNNDTLQNAFENFFEEMPNLERGFKSFADSLHENGDLADKLMTFIEKSITMNK